MAQIPWVVDDQQARSPWIVQGFGEDDGEGFGDDDGDGDGVVIAAVGVGVLLGKVAPGTT